jgi:hypothetical protein
MAKDPAMLWYWSDWNSGTTTFSRFLKGCYMDVMHAQFNSGHLTLEEIKTVLGSDFGTAWPTLQKKFKTDELGRYFNVRLEEEKLKRAAFTESRRKNSNSPKTKESSHKDNHMDELMVYHKENRNVNENTIQVFGNKKESFVSIRKVLANDRAKLIYDIQLYFSSRGQLETFKRAGWEKFDEFMEANPGKVFKDEDHLYNTFRRFCVDFQLNQAAGKKKKASTEEVEQWQQE